MEGLVYLSVRVGCAAYLLYKVWEQKKKVRELCDLLYTPAKREQMISMSPEPADEKEGWERHASSILTRMLGRRWPPI